MAVKNIFTQDSYHNVLFQYLNGTTGQEVESRENISTVNQSVSGRCMSGLEAHGQGPQASFCGSLESFAVV